MTRFADERSGAIKPAKAEVLLAGRVTRKALRGPQWQRTSYGYYLKTSQRPGTPTQRIAEAAALLPAGGVIGGWAAAYALGADLLDGLNCFTLQPEPILIFLPPGQHRRSTSAVVYRQDRLSATMSLFAPEFRWLRLCQPLCTWPAAHLGCTTRSSHSTPCARPRSSITRTSPPGWRG